MGKRGPARTPTSLLQIRGSRLVRERENEPTPEPGLPECPDWLVDDGKAEWDRLVPLLDAMGVLFNIDCNALARYCELWTQWKNALKWIREKGLVYSIKDEKGKVKCFQQWPQVGIANRLGEQISRLEGQFGMTPSSRAGLTINSENKTRSDYLKAKYFA